MAIVVLTQSGGWSYPCVSCLCDEGSQGGKIASEPVKWKFHCREVIPSDNPESAMIQSLCQKDCKLVLHACLCADDKSDGACMTRVVTSGHGLCLRGTSPPFLYGTLCCSLKNAPSITGKKSSQCMFGRIEHFYGWLVGMSSSDIRKVWREEASETV